jgi:hypothetical protein
MIRPYLARGVNERRRVLGRNRAAK